LLLRIVDACECQDFSQTWARSNWLLDIIIPCENQDGPPLSIHAKSDYEMFIQFFSVPFEIRNAQYSLSTEPSGFRTVQFWFFFLSLLFFSTAFYKYCADGRKTPERKQEKPALFFMYVKGLKIDPSGGSTYSLGLPGRDLKSRRVYFQTLLVSIRWNQIDTTKT